MIQFEPVGPLKTRRVEDLRYTPQLRRRYAFPLTTRRPPKLGRTSRRVYRSNH